DPRSDERTRDAVTEAAQLAGAPLLLGTVDYTPPEGRYNTSLLWTEEGRVLDEYRKQRPAPFAEYIPIRDFARVFSPEVDRVTQDVLPGEGPAMMLVPVDGRDGPVVIGPIICFEVAYDGIIRES